MIKKTNRVISLAMSAALMLTNMISPMTAYAEELTEDAAEEYLEVAEPEMIPEPETEAKEYMITLPWYEDIVYMVDEGRVYHPENERPEDKDIFLKYKADEKVDFAFTPADGITVTQIHLRDEKKEETFFETDEYGRISFLMPDKDLIFSLVYERYVPANETEDSTPAPVQDFPESEDASVAEDVPAYEETQSSADENSPEISDLADAPGESDPADTVWESDPADNAWEISDASDPVSQETGREGSEDRQEQEVPDIELTAVIEDDGLPAQGSIMTVDTLAIPYGSVFVAAADFTNIFYDESIDQVELVSDEVDVSIPGTYSTIYRISHNNGAKMWYVLRPVLVMEMGEVREGETRSDVPAADHESSDDEESSDGDGEDVTGETSVPAESLPFEEAVTEVLEGDTEAVSEELPSAETEDTLIAAEKEEILAPAETEETLMPAETEEALTSAETEGLMDTEPAETEGISEEETDETEDLSEEEAAETEDLSEEETEDTGDKYRVIINKGEDLGVTLDHEDGLYDAGETVSFTTDLPAGTLTAVAALKEESNEKVDTADILYSEVSYNASPDTFTFEMPEEDIVLEVVEDAALGTMLLAAASNDDWDDNTEVEAGSYYYYSDGTLHPFNSVMGSGGNDSYKYVRYKVDGKTYTVYAYCMQHSMTSPPSGTTYTSMIELDEGGDDKYLRKALFYGYGGPGWGDTFNGYNIQTIMTNYGCTYETRAMQHYLVDYLYDGESGFGGNLSSTAKSMLAEIKAALKKMPDPTATELKPGLSTKATSTSTETFTWKANEAFTITIHLEDGVKLVNETTGKSGTGNVKVKGGEKFHLEATGDMSKLKGKYEITSNYPLDFHAMLLKLASSQDIGFGYYTESKGLALSVEWPDEGYVSVQKTAADGKSYDLSGCHIGVYSDSAATKLVHEFVTKKDGSADAYKVSPGTYYAKEISVPEGWNLNTGIVKVTVAASNSTAAKAAIASVSNSRATKEIEIQKKDAVTGKTEPYNGSYSFTGMKVNIYSDAGLTSLVETLTTDAKGYAKSSPLQYGTYYVRETTAPKGYDIYDHTFTVVLANQVKVDGANASKALLTFADPPRKKSVEVQKIDADTGKAQPFNDRYSFDKMEVTIYFDSACKTAVTKITTDAKGYGKSTDLYYGTYYARETAAPSGYDLYDHTFTIIIDDTVKVDNTDTAKIPVKDPAKKKPVEVQKVDKDTGKTEPFNKNYSFDKMEVTIYRDKDLKTVEQVLVSDAKGYAKSKDLYYGTYYVRETKPPKGYQLYDHTFEVVIGNDITVDGKKVDKAYLTIVDEIIRKPVKVQKYDKEKGTTTPNNTAVTFKGAEYTIYEDAAMTKVLEVLVTDENGKAESKPYPYETYYVKETKTPVGYLPDEITYKVVIDDVVTVNGAAMDVIENKMGIVSSYEQVIRGDILVMKYLDDAVETSILQEWIDKEMLKGIEFTLTHEDETVTPVYGPPGTGKTYNAVICAVAICDGRPVEEVKRDDYGETLARYYELKNNGRIVFTTFHQSYGYEEFIEGIRPVMADDENGENLEYVIADGVFKNLCKAARTPEAPEIDHNASIWFVWLKDKGNNDLKTECFHNGEIRFDGPEEPGPEFGWTYSRLIKMKPGDFVITYYGGSTLIDGVGIIQDSDLSYDHSRSSYNWVRKVKWLITEKQIDVKAINSNKYLPNFNVSAMNHMNLSDLLHVVEENSGIVFGSNENPYVIVIDEINRGNISKIFGELITLIEDKKRSGADEAMEAILPYSGEGFSVPDNVYILGTMNTADRSIALMDTALRRRFEFVEMMPDAEVLSSLGIGTIAVGEEELNVARMLDVINERIEFLFDREHTIGHAFFTKLAEDPSIETLAAIFEKNVIPLLQEYFYEDYEKIQLVLGDNSKPDEYKFILDRTIKVKEIFNGNPDIDLPEKGYQVQHDAFLKLESYKQIGRDL